jgi:hypothetical protein
VLAERLEDAAFHLTPVTDVDAAEMLARLRGSRLLDGYGGGEAGDRAALADIILRVSALVEAVPELIELELSPIKVLAPGSGAVTVDGRMRLAPPG